MNTQKHAHPFYLFDLFGRLLKAKNIPAVIYLMLNIFVVVLVFGSLFGWTAGSVLCGIVIYLIAAVVALSPFGEWLLRHREGCKKLDTRSPEHVKTLNRLEPLFVEALERARKKQTAHLISDNIALYVKEDEDANAFALGRHTVCVTTGLLAQSDEQILGVLGHEIGHLAAHDTDLILLITVGNFIVTAIVSVFRLVIALYRLAFSVICMFLGGTDGLIGRLMTAVAGFLTLISVGLIMWLWTQLGVLLVMKTSRSAEYDADAFSCDLGYTEGLLSFFDELVAYEVGPAGKRTLRERAQIFAALSASHPATHKRIARIKERMGLDSVAE